MASHGGEGVSWDLCTPKVYQTEASETFRNSLRRQWYKVSNITYKLPKFYNISSYKGSSENAKKPN